RRRTSRDLALQDRRAGDNRNAQTLGSFDYGQVCVIYFLIRKDQRLWHRQVYRQLNETKVMSVTGYFARDFDHRFERVIARRVGLDTKSVPRCHSVMLYTPGRDSLLKKLKRGAQPAPEFLRLNGSELRFGIVHVVNVDTVEIQVAQRLLQLALEVSRRHAVRTARDVTPGRDSCLNEILFDVSPHVMGRRAVERQITTFRADDEFFTREAARLQVSQGCTNRPLASLKSIIGGRIDDVDAQLNGSRHCFRIAAISVFIRLAEIRPDADRGKAQALRFTKMSGRGAVCEALAIARSTFGSGVAVDCHGR